MALLERIESVAKALAPPALWRGTKAVKDRFVEPEWEYVPEGWERQRRDPRVKGWDVDAVAAASRARWPAFVASLQGTAPLLAYHEAQAGSDLALRDVGSHNLLVSYAYVLALAAAGRERVSVLDWGGGIGHYAVVARAALPGVQVDYYCKDVPKLAAAGRELLPEAKFSDDESALERRYDLVLASGSLQYAEDWRATLGRLAGATGRYLYVTRLPVARRRPSFVVVQRAYRYGYDTEYVGWVLNRDELLDATSERGLELVREFVLSGGFSARGAPENPIEHEGYLFRPRTAAS